MDYYDEYDYMLTEDDYDQERTNELHVQTFAETLQSCVQPSVAQIVSYLLVLLGTNLFCQLMWRWSIHRSWLQQSTSVVCGFAVLYFATGYDFLIVVFLSLLTYIVMLVLEYCSFQNTGIIVAALTIISHFLYEILWDQPDSWQRIRGIQMIATMKIISLAFDLEIFISNRKAGDDDNKLKTQHIQVTSVPALVPFLGYIFSPANCVLGPWIPYTEYMRSLKFPSKNIVRLLFSCVLNATLAVIFLCLSNCIVPLLCTEQAWKWVRTYRDALSVRCSHYFICFLAQATMTASGISPTTKLQFPHWTAERLLGHMVTKPWRIELPRSLSELVRNWNIPMHEWLKKYVFRAMHKHFGRNYLIAILSTYLVSALLHGMHLRIYAVLLSLGGFAYVENLLRRKLAYIFDACITAYACPKPCPFKHCPSHGRWNAGALFTALVNCCFSLLTIMHLAYLGIMMNTNENENVVSMENYLSKWLNLHYLSHWLALATYLFYLVI